MNTASRTISQVIREINDYIYKGGGGYADWYIGIATDPRVRLFNDHSVEKESDSWIFRDCNTDANARNVEEYFLNKGCDGGAGGGDSSTKYAYAYKKNSHTRP